MTRVGEASQGEAKPVPIETAELSVLLLRNDQSPRNGQLLIGTTSHWHNVVFCFAAVPIAR